MSYKITNNTTKDINILEKLVGQFYPYAHKTMGFSKPASIVFSSDVENGQNPLGKTAHYNPNINEITVYIDYRHPKDIMRSLSHELVHHTQNCRGEFADGAVTEEGYAQTNPHLREMEREAYELGNLCFRDWENQYNLNLQENKKMNEETLKKEIKEMLEEILAEEEVEEGFKSKAYNRDPESEDERKKKDEDEFGSQLAGAQSGVTESDEVDLEENEETELEETEEIEERTKTVNTAQARDAGGRRVEDAGVPVIKEEDEEVVEESEDTEAIEEVEDEELKEWWDKSLYTRLCESWIPKNKKEIL
tara:strand:- start:1130 stop:2047 length:918 start_codon:yes stop_codon:yes gene_type:complete